MLGSLVVFAFAVLIVVTYMTIVHKFLRSAEEPGDFEEPKHNKRPAARAALHSAEPRMAH